MKINTLWALIVFFVCSMFTVISVNCRYQKKNSCENLVQLISNEPNDSLRQLMQNKFICNCTSNSNLCNN